MDDPYKVLGVSRSATADEIRTAYRDLAKRFHPDLNPGNEKAEARFKDVSAAYDTLSDEDKRARFDRGEIDPSGAQRRDRHFHRGFGDGPGGGRYQSFEDVMADLFTSRGGGDRVKARGADVRYTLDVDFLEAANGAKKTVTMPDRRSLKISLPAGVREGQTLRLKGEGRPGLGGASAGDALVEIKIHSHTVFRRENNDIHMELPITLGEAVLGGKVSVPTISGSVTMTIPKGSNTGNTLRMKNKGVAKKGDQYVTLNVVLPEKIDADLARLVERWASEHPYDPRGALQRETSSK